VEGEYLFPGKNGGHITARYVEQLIKDLGRFARLEIHPHVLRRTAATNMIETGADKNQLNRRRSRQTLLWKI